MVHSEKFKLAPVDLDDMREIGLWCTFLVQDGQDKGSKRGETVSDSGLGAVS